MTDEMPDRPADEHDGEGATDLTITVVPSTRDGAPTVVKVHGELDLATSAQLRGHLARLGGAVELDLTGLVFLDSSGMNALIDAHRACEARGDAFVIRGASGIVLRALTVTGLAEFLDLRP